MNVGEQKSNGIETYRRYKCPECKWTLYTEEKSMADAKKKISEIHRKYKGGN